MKIFHGNVCFRFWEFLTLPKVTQSLDSTLPLLGAREMAHSMVKSTDNSLRGPGSIPITHMGLSVPTVPREWTHGTQTEMWAEFPYT